MTRDFSALAVPGVGTLQPYQPGKPIGELERELGITDSIKLASNENPLGPSAKAIEAIRAQLGDLALYPDGNGFALKQALAARHEVPPEWITLGNGSNEVLELVARTFLMPGREAVYAEHAFEVYRIVTQATGATERIAPANAPDHPMPYGHDLDAMHSLLNDDTRVAFIANPNNPTGTWLDRRALSAFLEASPEQVICVVDEAYFEYVQEPAYPDASTWLRDYPNLIVTRTFSKIFGLAGLRVGYGVSHPEIADLLNRVRQPFNVNSLAQVGALAALEDNAHVQRSVDMNNAGLMQLGDACRERGLSYIPTVSNFLCVDLARPALPVYDALLRDGVIVRALASYGFPNHLRITVGTEAQNRRVIHALDRALK